MWDLHENNAASMWNVNFKTFNIWIHFMHLKWYLIFKITFHIPACYYLGLLLSWIVIGSLLDYLRGNKHLVTKSQILIDMVFQVCAAMKYLEEEGFIHRDLVSISSFVFYQFNKKMFRSLFLFSTCFREHYKSLLMYRFWMKNVPKFFFYLFLYDFLVLSIYSSYIFKHWVLFC